MSSTTCRFLDCNWTGPIDEIFTHCEYFHKNYIREHKNQNFYDFVFEDITKPAFLLSGPNGLYWFCLDPTEHVNKVSRGVFHIGDSEPIKYELKLGLLRDGRADYLGPFMSLSAESDQIYEVDFEFGYIELINGEIPSRKMRLYVGDYDDSDDKFNNGSKLDLWEEDEKLNKLCQENFQCCVCYEYIRRDIRFCERSHYVCLKCFDYMEERKQLRCPICREGYPIDCSCPNLEQFLRMVKFPDTDEEDEDMERPSTSKKSIMQNRGGSTGVTMK